MTVQAYLANRVGELKEKLAGELADALSAVAKAQRWLESGEYRAPNLSELAAAGANAARLAEAIRELTQAASVADASA